MLMEQGIAALELGLPAPSAMYDIGFYNIGVRPTGEDLGIGGMDPFMNPLSFARQLQSGLFVDDLSGDLAVDPCLFARSPCATTINAPVAVNGSFKVPTLRNIELTAPYMHNGGHLTLFDVIAFYARGADFGAENIADLDPAVAGIGGLRASPARVATLEAFLRTFTDPRVRNESGPFDHPSILLENGILVEATGASGAGPLRALEDRLDGPTARYDNYATDVDVPLSIAAPGVLANDTDGDGDTVQDPVMIAMEGPFHGIVSTGLMPDGSFDYTPDPGFRGIDSFAYDVTTDNALDPRSNVARVLITVGDDVPAGNPDMYQTDFGTDLIVAAPGVLANDVDDGALTAILVDTPDNGVLLTGLNSDGSFAYRPNPGFSGTDTFTYTPNDAGGPGNETTVTIQVVAAFTPCPTSGISLCYSLTPNRANPRLLDGATLSGIVYIFVWPTTSPPIPNIKKTAFYIDFVGRLKLNQRFSQDTQLPYDLIAGTVATAGQFNANSLSNGEHVLRAGFKPNSGGPLIEVPQATFTVQ
jgi:hypothetical protein